MSKISDERKDKIRRHARNRCGYCLTPQQILSMPLEFDHIIPKEKIGGDDDSNLWLACRNCNGFKHSKTEVVDPETGQIVSLFNPRKQTGVIILNSAGLEPKLSAKRSAGVLLLPLCD